MLKEYGLGSLLFIILGRKGNTYSQDRQTSECYTDVRDNRDKKAAIFDYGIR